jgi:A/G-specific adenine glycosylase
VTRSALKSLTPDRAALLLDWYDRNRRVLPWRALPHETSDPYRVWLSEIMLQQTTVKAVVPYFAKFLARWPDVAALGQADLDDVLRLWAGLGYYSRARNLHACAVAVLRDHDGAFPDTEQALRTLPGVGAYTAAAIAAIAFGRNTMPVDGNIERVVSRLFAVEETLPRAKPRIAELATTLLPPMRPGDNRSRAGDSAQALMDLGATICTPKRPACALCPLSDDCAARLRGDAETFPRKPPKKAGTLRKGAAFVVQSGDKILVRTRPSKGLLGGMTEVPTTEWSADFDETTAMAAAPPVKAIRWRKRDGVVNHVFTHFPLDLVVFFGAASESLPAPNGMRWVAIADLADEALPNLMRKVIAHGLADDKRPDN